MSHQILFTTILSLVERFVMYFKGFSFVEFYISIGDTSPRRVYLSCVSEFLLRVQNNLFTTTHKNMTDPLAVSSAPATTVQNATSVAAVVEDGTTAALPAKKITRQASREVI